MRAIRHAFFNWKLRIESWKLFYRNIKEITKGFQRGKWRANGFYVFVYSLTPLVVGRSGNDSKSSRRLFGTFSPERKYSILLSPNQLGWQSSLGKEAFCVLPPTFSRDCHGRKRPRNDIIIFNYKRLVFRRAFYLTLRIPQPWFPESHWS